MGRFTNISKNITVAFDVVGSRTYPDKNIIRIKLKSICHQLNVKYNKYLAVEFQIKDGDSVIGVLSSFQLGFLVYRDVRKLAWLHDLNLYFGLGFGTLDTGEVIDPDEINGSSVINAFSAINFAKNDELQKYNHVRFFAYDDTGIIPYQAINSLVHVIYNEFSGKTPKQRDLIKVMELNPELTQEEIGEKMGYEKNAKENINKLLSRTNYDLYKDMQKDVFDLLKKLQRILR
ncbi:SatD family protein [Peribacillus frigoritolerans]|uniref:SatD family protein n=1 Tax=Peribacillus frigoritolerans TaxID=450367 RepID=UPI002B244F6A|nr:SatD family protein [Peribacillus frigoritolerans]MEB2631964.1 SatD family protein [Peribacillus frigoritolerans]